MTAVKPPCSVNGLNQSSWTGVPWLPMYTCASATTEKIARAAISAASRKY